MPELLSDAWRARAEVESARNQLMQPDPDNLAVCSQHLTQAIEVLRSLAQGAQPLPASLRQPLEGLRSDLRRTEILRRAGATWNEARIAMSAEAPAAGYTAEGTEPGPRRASRISVRG